ncbi:MAG: outer membrane protein transport protein [Polyangiales bacterium]
MLKPYKSHTRISRLALGAMLLALGVLVPRTAHAGGLYLFDRGARALGRGGAFIAAPDDPSALWYNPAGLAESKNQIVADAVLPLLFADFTRQYADGTYAPKLEAKPTPIPIPTLAMSHDLGFDDLTFGLGIFAPNVLLMNWERSVGEARDPSPARYSIIGLKGSVLANLAAGFAYHGLKPFSFGADVQLAAGQFKAETALSACDGVICSFPEQKDFDAYATIKAFPALGITGVFGMTLNLDALRLGASVMLPYTLKGWGKADINIPTNPIFEDAVVAGDKASLTIKFPTIVRIGGEIRPVPYLRMEGAFVWEQWSRQKSIDVDVSGVELRNVVGIGDYRVGDVKLQRDMRDAWSVRGGFEFFVPKRWMVVDIDLALRGGLAYEKGAFSSQTLTPLTLDTDKVVLSGGLSIGLARWLTFDTVAGYIFMKDLDVTDSTIHQPQAIRPTSQVLTTVIGNGRYAQDAIFLGGGFRIKL